MKDALISVMIVSMICLVVTALVTTHVKIDEKINEQYQYQQEDLDDFYQGMEVWKESVEEMEQY